MYTFFVDEMKNTIEYVLRSTRAVIKILLTNFHVWKEMD